MTRRLERNEHEHERVRLLTSSSSKYLRFSLLYFPAMSGSLPFCVPGGPGGGGTGGGPMTTSCGGPICALGVWLMNVEGRGRELMGGKGRGRGRGVRLYRWWWARGSGQLFGPIPHFLSQRTASHFEITPHSCAADMGSRRSTSLHSVATTRDGDPPSSCRAATNEANIGTITGR